MINDNGNAVRPHPPQHTKIGYPIKQNTPNNKHGTVILIYML